MLFARPDSFYKSLPGCDVFDITRDARTFTGHAGIVAHPPCRAWGRLRTFAKPRNDEKELALFALAAVRRNGGVLEHPRGSTLWQHASLPAPGAACDAFGGWTLGIHQREFGHRAEKPTLLYIVGVERQELPPLPHLDLGYASHVIGGRIRVGGQGRCPDVSKAEREHTPPALALWLVVVADLARRNRAAAGGRW